MQTDSYYTNSYTHRRLLEADGYKTQGHSYKTFLDKVSHIEWMTAPYEISWSVKNKVIAYYLDYV